MRLRSSGFRSWHIGRLSARAAIRCVARRSPASGKRGEGGVAVQRRVEAGARVDAEPIGREQGSAGVRRHRAPAPGRPATSSRPRPVWKRRRLVGEHRAPAGRRGRGGAQAPPRSGRAWRGRMAACSSDSLPLRPTTGLERAARVEPEGDQGCSMRAGDGGGPPVTTSPPSATANGLVTWKEKTWVSPSAPARGPVVVVGAERGGGVDHEPDAGGVARAPPGGASGRGAGVPKVEQPSTPATRSPCSARTRSSAAGRAARRRGRRR